MSIVQDIRYAVRGLRQNPGFTVVVALTMALGIGVNTSLFTVVNAFVFRPLPVADPQTLYGSRFPTRAGEFDYFRRYAGSFCEPVASVWVLPTLGDGSSGEVVHGNQVSSNYFSVLGVRAAVGRFFADEDYRTTGGNAVVLNHAFWERTFHADPGAIGKSVTLSGRDYVIVGIAERGFIGTMPLVANFWTMLPENLEAQKSWVHLLVRLKPGITQARAQAELAALRQRYSEAQGEPKGQATVILDSRATFIPLRQNNAWLVALLMVCVGLVLVIACANVANLLLARAAARQREIAVRLSLGASRPRLLQQLLTESVLVALIGGAVGLLAAAWLMPAASMAIQSQLPKIWGVWAVHLTPDLRVFAYTAAMCVAAGVLFGLTPALQATKPDLAATLKDGGAQGLRWSRSRLRSGLVIAEVSLCLVLLINAGLLTRSLRNAHTAEPGFDVDKTLIVQLDRREGDQDQTLHARVMDRVREVPGVELVAAGKNVPLLSAAMASLSDGRTAYNYVTATYFQTLGIPILRGRTFTPQEESGDAPVAVISESAARKLYPGQNPLGQALTLLNRTSIVIGVARDTRSIRLSEPDPAYVYLPMSPERLAQGVHVFARATNKADALLAPIRKSTVDLAQGRQVLIYPFDMAIGFQRLPAEAGAMVSAVLGALALLLACVGIYGVISYAVSQRTHEIGVRMALGANARDVIALVLRQGMKLVAVGVALGMLGAAPLAYVLKFLLYGISPLDPWAFVGVPVLLIAFALLAMCTPTLRAARVEPLQALRHD